MENSIDMETISKLESFSSLSVFPFLRYDDLLLLYPSRA